MAVMALLERSALLHLFIVSLVVLPSHCFVICNTGKTALAHSSYRSRGPQDNRPSVKHVNRALVQSLTPTRRAERARRPLVRAGAWMGVSAVDVEKGGVRQGANQGTAVPWRTCRRRRVSLSLNCLLCTWFTCQFRMALAGRSMYGNRIAACAL